MYRIDVNGINNAFKIKNFFFGGQPDSNGLQFFIDAGVKKVYNLRAIGEADFLEQEQFLKDNQIEYSHLPILGAAGFDSDAVKDLSKLKHGDEEEKVLIHCASGNRIAAWYIIYLVQNMGLSIDQAYEEGLKSGLTNPALFDAVEVFLASQ